MTTQTPTAPAHDLAALGREAFLYGFPLVFDLQELQRFTQEGMASLPRAGLNEFSHATALAGPQDRFVTINNDTVYSLANVDTSDGPVRLEVPDTAGRYYVLQFVDTWTNNFAYVGHRATGTEAAAFVLVSPDWDGESPSDATLIRCPTALATIVGRFAVAGEEDMPAVRALQAALRLMPSGAGAGLPEPDARVREPLRFFEQLRVWGQAFPPAERDRVYQGRFEPLGLFAAQTPYADPEPAFAAALEEGLKAGRAALEAALRSGSSPKQNGWDLTYHVFDYNLDFFELGALDDPRWQLSDGPARYLQRAAAARGGLLGNHGYEAAYAQVYVDADGAPLDGAHRYELRFRRTPPCRAFWSVTMYDAQDFFLVANQIDRYSIGDRTAGLRYSDDGSLTITLQADEPDEPDRRANWLPTPASAFRPLLRVYEPDDAIFDGSYELPPIVRVA